MPGSSIQRVDYREYIQSPQWHWKAELAKSHCGNRCQNCNRPGSEVELETYHRTYERLGNELLDDLIVLCRSCHRQFKKGKLQTSLATTDPYALLTTTAVAPGNGRPARHFLWVFLALGVVGAIVGFLAVYAMPGFPLGPPGPPTPISTEGGSPSLLTALGVLPERATPTPTPTRVPPTPTPSPTHTPTSTPSSTPTSSPTPTPSPTPTSTPSPTPTLSPTPTEPVSYYYLKQNANIRRGPGTRFPVARVAKAGELLDVVGCNTPCEWYELADGTWVREYLVIESADAPP